MLTMVVPEAVASVEAEAVAEDTTTVLPITDLRVTVAPVMSL